MVQSFKDFNVVEERQFTNPRVRFIRVNGRVVPIVNKQKVGQDLQGIGGKTAAVGAVGVAVGVVKRTKTVKNLQARVSKFKARPPSTSIFARLERMTRAKPKALPAAAAKIKIAGRAQRSVASAVRAGGKLVKFGAKYPGRIGSALVASGVLLNLLGTDMELDSRFGKDVIK